MSALCDQLAEFADGELSSDEANRFRGHLAGCAVCQRELHELIGLELRVRALPPEVLQVPARRARRTWPMVAALLVPALAASTVLLVRSRADRWAELRPSHRSIEARLSSDVFGEHREYSPLRASEHAAAPVPLRALAALEEQGERQLLAEAWLEHGEAKQAAAALAALPHTADTDSDRAALALVEGRPAEALAFADAALKQQAAHRAARWNRGLALRELGLYESSASELESVAAAKERGWSEEAAQRSAAQRDLARAQRADWDRAQREGYAMVAGGPPLDGALVRAQPGLSRLFFYDAVRAAPDRRRLDALRALAATLDAVSGHGELTRWLDRASKGPFPVELIDGYRALAHGAHPEGSALERLTAEAERVGRVDLSLGLMLFRGTTSEQAAARYAQVADATGDMWFRLLARQQLARAALAHANRAEAERRLRELVASCPVAGAEYRCASGGVALAELLAAERRLEEAGTVIASAERWAEASGDWSSRVQLLALRAEVARLSAAWSLAAAYLEERRLREPGQCRTERFVGLSLASIRFQQREPQAVRDALAKTPSCGEPLSLQHLVLLADLQRSGRNEAEIEQLRGELARWRDRPGVTPGDRALVDVIAARLSSAIGAPDAEARVQEAVDRPLGATAAEDERAARAFAHATAISHFAAAGSFDKALSAFAHERGAEAPTRCAAAVSLDDERLTWVAVGAGGRIAGRFDRTSDPAQVAAPPAIEEALQGCAQVTVLARPPLQARAGLLSPAIAWSVGRPTPAPPASAGGPVKRLVVHDARPPASLGLPALASRPSLEGATVLAGPAASPRRVLAELEDADEVQLHVHGWIDAVVPGAARLILSPEPDGTYALPEAAIRSVRLRHAPVVVLAACFSGGAGASTHETADLPSAFLASGARAVFASAGPVPDAKAPRFFDALLARIRSGATPAEALRDERLASLAAGETWVTDVLLYE